MSHQFLKALAACLCLAGSGLLIGSIFEPHVLLIANREPPALPILPELSVWLGFLHGETILTLGSRDPVVTTFHYEKGHYCKDVCTSLRDGGMAAVAAVCVAAGLLVASATLILVSMSSLGMKPQPPVIGGTGQYGATPALFLWSRKLCGWSAMVVCGGLGLWFMILKDVRDGKPPGGRNDLTDFTKSPDFGLDQDHTYTPGTSAFMLMGALASSLVSTLVLTVANVYERLYLAEVTREYHPLPQC